MFVVSVSHHVKPDRLEDARRMMMGAGEGMAARDGFVFRYLAASADDSHELVSFTAWLSEEHAQRSLDAIIASGAKWPDPADPDSPYLDVERRHFNVAHFVLPGQSRRGDELQFALHAEDVEA